MIVVMFYLMVVVAYMACFVAFMNSKRGNNYYWDVYKHNPDADSWLIEYCFGLFFGAFLWPLSIPGYFLFKLVYKQAEKFFNK